MTPAHPRHTIAAIFMIAMIWSHALAQTFTYELRLTRDFTSGQPSLPQGVPAFDGSTGTLGLTLQARVMVTGGTNYGIARFASGPDPNQGLENIVSSLTASTTIPNTRVWLERGLFESSLTKRGRFTNYRFGSTDLPEMNSATANPPNSGPFPNLTNAENGILDSENTRIYGIDATTQTSRQGIDLGDGFINPFPVLAPSGEFSPWTNLYRFYLRIEQTGPLQFPLSGGTTVTAAGLIQGVSGVSQTDTGLFSLVLAAPQQTTAVTSYFFIPSPSAAPLLATSILLTTRRRR